jgi:uncharacterized protein
MKRFAAFITSVLTLTTAALAQGPTYDCAKANGEVEALICNDAGLMALDRTLADAYLAALAKAKGTLATRLREEQRGWVKGRNDCWKAKNKTWITATWTVDSVKGCIDAQYRLRTSELQAVWRLVQPQTVAYACQHTAANELVANFFPTDPATIRLERGDRTVTLWQVGTASDGLYEGQNISLVHQGTDTKLSWLDTHTGKTDELQCTAK